MALMIFQVSERARLLVNDPRTESSVEYTDLLHMYGRNVVNRHVSSFGPQVVHRPCDWRPKRGIQRMVVPDAWVPPGDGTDAAREIRRLGARLDKCKRGPENSIPTHQLVSSLCLRACPEALGLGVCVCVCDTRGYRAPLESRD